MQNRIKELMKQNGISRDELAAMIGAHPTTVSRLISGTLPLNADWLQKLAVALRCTPDQIIAPRSNVRRVTVRSHVQAGVWSETSEWDPDDWYDVAIPDTPTLRAYDLFGAETRGPSMNRRYPEGTVVVCTSAIQTGADIEVGKRYVVERERPDGQREATIKTLWKDESGRFWLVPESTDPRFQEPFPLDGAEGDTVRIVGRVQYSVQRED